MERRLTFDTPGRECAHADMGQCPECQLRPHRYKPMKGNSAIPHGMGDFLKLGLANGWAASLRMQHPQPF